MSPARKRNLRLAGLLAVLVATGALLYRDHVATLPGGQVAQAPSSGPAEGTETAPPPPPPGAEVVPPEESETDRGPASATPSGPTLSFGRAAGLHLTPDPLKLNSSAALLVNQDSGEVLLRKKDQVVLPIASLTKLMTTLLVLEAKQPMDEVLTITEEDVDNERHSRSRLRVGTQLTREEALHLALMSSENRAAHALGRSYPGGLEKMVEAMNARARTLGMRNTTYVDPTGLSNRNRSTARDLALLVGEASRVPLLREFSTDPDHVAALGNRTLQYRNSNRLVRAGWDIELQKTGYIVEAGRCLTMLAKVAGHELVMVLLDAGSNGERLADAQRLRRWVVAQNGWQDNFATAKPRAESRRVAVAKKKERADAAPKKKTAVAKAEPQKKGGKTAVAKKEPPSKEGRVRETFAAGKEYSKS